VSTLGSNTKSSGVTRGRQGERRAALCVGFYAHRPLERGSRHVLDADEVTIGRGDASGFDRRSVDGREKLVIRVADPRMSSAHAQLRRVGGRWTVRDTASKNGTYVNGKLVDAVPLADADVIEVGGTFVVFRDSDPIDPTPLDQIADEATAPLGIATLQAPFARDLARLAQVARSTISVVLLGESGTGKEVLARAIHAVSGRAGPLYGVNCGALPATLVETELFGCKKGAFSGAVADRIGVLRSADRGTLLLDEIGELPLVSQPALLRVLQEREVVPVGDTRPIPVDLRVVCATHRDLGQLVQAGSFREDLLARLSGFELRVPPLRERREDLGTLLRALLLRLAPDRAETVTFTRHAARAIHRYAWPKNVRELEKCLEAALVLSSDASIDVGHLPAPLAAQPAAPLASPVPPPLTPEDDRRRAELVRLLDQHGGNISAVARDLDKARVQIQRWVKRYGLRPEDYRRE
jgi:transcriptional regulator of acetoin/glycerol metabolism